MKLHLGMSILFAKDIDKLKRFYIKYFELTMTEVIPGQWIVLQAGSCGKGKNMQSAVSKLLWLVKTPDDEGQ